MAHRLFTESQLVMATHNAGKLREFRDLLAPLGIEVLSATDLNLDEPEETGTTFTENAIIKAKAAALHTGLPALADDSGLAVHALNGDPGVYSARWAGAHKDFNMAMQLVLNKLADHADRTAHFACVLALCWPDTHVEIAEGRVMGTITPAPRGNGGFGYDPIFQPDGHTHTFGEMDKAAKHGISHRGNAIAALLAHVFPNHA
jgi:XTP/dITP diphosphohydrolase